MEELSRLLKLRKCHFELYYSSVMDFCMKLYLKEFNEDGKDLVIFKEQSCDLDYLVSKCKVAYKDWLNDNNGGNEVSIIINGVRYDAVQTDNPKDTCNHCDLVDVCNEVTTDCCVQLLPKYYRFKKSDKKFEV